MLEVKPIREASKQLLHAHRNGILAHAHEEMEMVRHQAIRIQSKLVVRLHIGEQIEKVIIVRVVQKNLLPGVAPRHHMKYEPGLVDAGRSTHSDWNTVETPK